MARPLVLVYQEFAAVTVTPDIPDLNCLISGPAYWIMDYLDDKGDILAASTYGTLDADNPYIAPSVGTDALTIAEPPGNKTGALLEAASVNIYFDECRVLMEEATDGVVDANINVLTSASGTFDTNGVAAGDYLIIDDPANPGETISLRVLAVDSDTVLRTTTNFTASDTGMLYRIEREVDDVLLGSAFIEVTSNQIVVLGGATTVLTGEVSARVINFAKVYVQYRSLRQDLRNVDTVSSETEVTTKIGKVDARNPLAGVCVAALTNTTTPVQFFGVMSDDSTGHNDCIEIIEGRKDVYAVVPLTTSLPIIAAYDTNFTQLASVATAEASGLPQKFRSVLGAQTLPTEETISGAYTAGKQLSVTGAIAGTPIVAADAINVFADGDATFVTDGVRAGDTLVIVSDATREGTYTVAEVYDENRLRTTTAFPGATATAMQYYIIRSTGTPVASTACVAGIASTGPDLYTADAGVAGLAAHLGDILRITSASDTDIIGDWLITASAVATPAEWTPLASLQNPPAGSWVAATDGVSSLVAPLTAVTVARTVATRQCFRVIRDNSATFVSDLVIATDLLQVPNPYPGTDYTTVAPYAYEVAYIPNENEVVLVANTDVISIDPETADPDTLTFRIRRELSKDDQIDALITIAQSINSRRTVLVWPDEVTVTGLVDGSKTRVVASTPVAADPQPGYYLGGVVGGMTAGLPSHQGFTNLGIAGVDEITHSTRYFSDTQLTELSDGGWFVFAQDTPAALPYCIHQLTTDPSTLETGEYSVVKNFDFVSLFFQDIMDDYLGEYNINEETIGLIEGGLNSGIDLLKLRKYAKIGAPLNSATVTSVAQHASAADRVEAYMDIELPKPLNRVGLHLIST